MRWVGKLGLVRPGPAGLHQIRLLRQPCSSTTFVGVLGQGCSPLAETFASDLPSACGTTARTGQLAGLPLGLRQIAAACPALADSVRLWPAAVGQPAAGKSFSRSRHQSVACCRFREHELVTGPLGVRAYIGAPLVLTSGYRAGVL